MITLGGLREYNLGPSAICMGKFDGVHLGHVELLRRTVALAKEMGAKSVAVTFDRSPLGVLSPGPAPWILTPELEKRGLMESIGLDVLIIEPFTREFAAIEANDYLHLLCNQLTPRAVLSGQDFRFGRGALGDAALIARMADELQYRAVVVEPLQVDGRVVSSTAIREALAGGDRAAAERMLGRKIKGE